MREGGKEEGSANNGEGGEERDDITGQKHVNLN